MITTLVLAGALVAAPQPRIGSDVSIGAATQGPVIGALASVLVEADVDGDVVALGGDVTLAPGVRVSGDVVAIGGKVRNRGQVAGRVVSLETLEGFAFGSQGPSQSASFNWGLRCLRVGGWCVLAAMLFLLAPRPVRRAGNGLLAQPVRHLAVGLFSLGVWFAAVVLALPLLGSGLGVVLLLLAVVGFLAAKVLGMVAVAWWLGLALRRFLPVAGRGESTRTALGMLVLAAAGLVPVLGGPIWLLANLFGFGAVVSAVVMPHALTLRLPVLAAR